MWRIAVFDAYATDEINIKNRFNELCRQFKNNKKYSSFLSFADMIPDSVNVAYEITTNKKRYEASFCQVEDSTYLNSLRKIVENKVFSLPREEQKEIIAAEIEKFNKKSVWFTIGEYLGSYRILMYYDNGYNRANGEDL